MRLLVVPLLPRRLLERPKPWSPLTIYRSFECKAHPIQHSMDVIREANSHSRLNRVLITGMGRLTTICETVLLMRKIGSITILVSASLHFGRTISGAHWEDRLGFPGCITEQIRHSSLFLMRDCALQRHRRLWPV